MASFLKRDLWVRQNGYAYITDLARHNSHVYPKETSEVSQLCVINVAWKAARPLLARLECHRRHRLDCFLVSVDREASKFPEKGDVLHAEIGRHHLPLVPGMATQSR